MRRCQGERETVTGYLNSQIDTQTKNTFSTLHATGSTGPGPISQGGLLHFADWKLHETMKPFLNKEEAAKYLYYNL